MSKPRNSPFALSSVPVTFLSVMALLVIVLGWLGWLLLDQDRSLEEQRTRERVDAAAAELENALSDGIAAERSRLDEIAGVLSSGQGVWSIYRIVLPSDFELWSPTRTGAQPS